MRYAAALALCLSFSSLCAQDLMSVPMDSITHRLNIASVEMRKAAWSRNTSIWWAVGGSLFTAMAMDKSAKAYDANLALGLGAFTAAGFVTFQLKGAKHDKRASRYLHQ